MVKITDYVDQLEFDPNPILDKPNSIRIEIWVIWIDPNLTLTRISPTHTRKFELDSGQRVLLLLLGLLAGITHTACVYIRKHPLNTSGFLNENFLKYGAIRLSFSFKILKRAPSREKNRAICVEFLDNIGNFSSYLFQFCLICFVTVEILLSVRSLLLHLSFC